MTENLEAIGEGVDRLLSVDVNGRGIIGKLYPIARELQGRPLALTAAERLVERVKPGDFVLMATGLTMVGNLLPENDGPVGAAVLARALNKGVGAKSILLVNDEYVDMMEATVRGAGVVAVPLERLRDVDRGVSVLGFPIEEKKAERFADSIMADYGPKAVIAIERRGPNEKGVYHSVFGQSMSEHEGKVRYLFDRATASGSLTVGIADGCGHEIGFGKIKERAKHLLPRYTKCNCPCGAGIADSTIVDTFVVANVSNWGAYGIAACMSALLRNPAVLHDKETELRTLRECVDHGGIDGVCAEPALMADGMPAEISAHIVEILREIVRNGLK